MICPHCGYDNHESATYCEKCGGKLFVREAETGSDETVAFGGSTEAGRTNRENGRTEYYAGWNGDWGSPQDDGGYQENRCRRCGSLLDNDCKYCPVCGEPVPGRQMQMPPKPSGDSGKNSKSLTKQILIVLLVLFLQVIIFIPETTVRMRLLRKNRKIRILRRRLPMGSRWQRGLPHLSQHLQRNQKWSTLMSIISITAVGKKLIKNAKSRTVTWFESRVQKNMRRSAERLKQKECRIICFSSVRAEIQERAVIIGLMRIM